MTNHHDIEKGLTRIAEGMTLRTEEKDAQREALRRFMAQNPLPRRSPLAWLNAAGARYAGAFAFLLMVSGSAVSAGTAQPGDTLYLAKIKVLEPAQSVLIFDTSDRTAFEVDRADRRLKEFAVYASRADADPETTAHIVTSLNESIDEVSEDIDEYTGTNNPERALRANSGLQSVLAAHRTVLEELEEGTAAASTVAVSVSVETALAETENAERGIIDQLESEPVDTEMVTDRDKEIDASLAAVRGSIGAYGEAFSTEELEAINRVLGEIEEIVADAAAAAEAGDGDNALVLYAEADQRIQAISTTIDADRQLGIDLIDEGE